MPTRLYVDNGHPSMSSHTPQRNRAMGSFARWIVIKSASSPPDAAGEPCCLPSPVTYLGRAWVGREASLTGLLPFSPERRRTEAFPLIVLSCLVPAWRMLGPITVEL